MNLPDLKTSKILIIQNKGGGHGEIGYQLCKTLKSISSSVEVVVLQDDCNYTKQPFASYSKDLVEPLHINVINEKLTGSNAVSSISSLNGMKFDYVIDNWSKNSNNASFVMEISKNSEAKQHIFISSAGMYLSSGNLPLTETDPVKENDARKIELTVMQGSIPYTFLRPQVYLEKNLIL